MTVRNLIDLSSSDTSVATSDASASGLREEDLRYLENRLVSFREEELTGRLLVPVTSDAPWWAKEVQHDEVVDRVYRDEENEENDEFTAEQATEFMQVEEDIEPRTNAQLYRVLGYELKAQEVAAARENDRPIRTRGTRVMRRAHFRFEDRLIFLGSTAYGIPGLATTGNAQTVAPLNANDWPTKLANGNPEDILADVDRAVEQLENQVGMMPPWDLGIPRDRYALLNRTRIAPTQGDTRTLLEIIENKENVGQVVPVSQLEDTDGAGQHTLLALAPDANPDENEDAEEPNFDVLTSDIARMLDPQTLRNDNVLLRSRITTAGLRIFDADAIVQMDGV